MTLLGFKQRYNRNMFHLFGGITALFAAANLQFIDQDHMCPSNPSQQYGVAGTCFYEERHPRVRKAMAIHLACILPAALLACLQFIPAIRQRHLFAHRIFGRINLALSFVSTISNFAMSGEALGGTMASLTITWTMGILFLWCLAMGYYHAKNHRIEQHRIWMFRAWVYVGSIITTRPLTVLLSFLASKYGEYYIAKPCSEVAYLIANNTELLQKHPLCEAFLSGKSPTQWTVVRPDFFGNDMAEVSGAMTLVLGPATWVSLVVHMVAAEYYLNWSSTKPPRLSEAPIPKEKNKGGLSATKAAKPVPSKEIVA
ncbi:hypothetical protein CFIMG_008411RA00001 [Ceratocystis fimbriata CBS 114723]|uniref:Uncharacterized protein n=1 Tax=Ceratocystis fimbriata CBS 114723 TaxID=1035309 RepID=A0A2C5X3J6_9PEZI|nr:hypothetical protein CFIMG_008411RA00001 [Ceratocystis fimbriata CBS 114723]